MAVPFQMCTVAEAYRALPEAEGREALPFGPDA